MCDEDELQLAFEVVDQLDLGLVVCDAQMANVFLVNTAGRAALAAFGAHSAPLPANVKEAVRELLTQRSLVGESRTAVELVDSSQRKFFIRARILREGVLMLLINAAVLRDRDLSEILHRRFELSSRDSIVVSLVRRGQRNREIGQSLGISVNTVKKYLNRIFAVLEVRNRTELVNYVDRLHRSEQD